MDGLIREHRTAPYARDRLAGLETDALESVEALSGRHRTPGDAEALLTTPARGEGVSTGMAPNRATGDGMSAGKALNGVTREGMNAGLAPEGGRSAPPSAAVAQAHVLGKWYAVYTCANHERRVAEQFRLRGIEHFFPQYESVRKWKDRTVRLQMPLFPGYVFVQMVLAHRFGVLQVPGVARLVGFDGQPAAVPEDDLLRVREFLRRGFRAEPHRILKVGRRVRVRSGPLEGMEGIVARRKNGRKLVISFELIQQAMAVEIGADELEGL